jgi:hypothetical protein
MTTKKIIGIAALVIAALALFGYEKVQKLKTIFDKMTMLPVNIHSIDVNFQRLAFTIDIKLSNPTKDNFYATSMGAASLDAIKINYKGKFLANAKVNITDIDVPAQGSIILKDIDVEIPTMALLQNALTFDYNNISMADISVSGIVTAFGTQYVIEN